VLENHLDIKSKISLLKSDRWLVHLLNHDLLDVSILSTLALNDSLFGHARRESKEMAFTFLEPNGNFGYQLTFIAGLSERFLNWQGDKFVVKQEYLNEWLAICAEIDPLIIIGYSYTQRIKKQQIQPKQIQQLKQCPLALPSNTVDYYADNHSHLGGHGSHRNAFVEFSYHPFDVDAKKFNWPTLTQYSFINAGQFKASDLPRLQHALFSHLIENLLFKQKNSSGPSLKSPISCKSYNIDLINRLKGVNNEQHSIELLTLALQSEIDKRALLLWTGLFYAELNESVSVAWKRSFRSYIHTTQILRSAMLHSGLGLSYFTEFFRFKHRKGTKSNYTGYSANSDLSELVYREFKVSPEMANITSLKHTFQFMKDKTLDGHLQHCLHFNRGSKNSADKLQRAKRLEIKKEVGRLEKLFSSYDAQKINISGGFEERYTQNIVSLIKGLDVAGNENELKIEIFAPSLRYLRSSPWKNPYPHYSPHPKLRLSVHAGEDYNHLLSGIRHIDETVVFCNFDAGDRLGHALALGVDPLNWAQENKVVHIKAGEHFDNLVWWYRRATEISIYVPEMIPLAFSLEMKAKAWASELFSDKSSHQMTTLYDAWHLRQNCPMSYQMSNKTNRDLFKEYLPDFDSSIVVNTEALKYWESYFMAEKMKGKSKNLFEKIVLIRHLDVGHPDCRTDIDKGVDFFTFKEIELITALQDYLMTSYDRKGITIEACPSSNIYIGHFNCYSNHPIFRWDPPRKELLAKGAKFNLFGLRNGPVRVCVNTDDAGLFPTTISNEHNVLKNTALSNFDICQIEANSWIDRIRGVGLFEFKRVN
jgi:hypothetical protein